MPYDDATHRNFALPGSRLQYGPDKQVDVQHIDLHLEPDLERARMDAVCTTTVRALDEPVSSLSLDAVDLRVREVRCGEKTLRFEVRDRKLVVRFEPAIACGTECTFAVDYAVERPRHGLFFIEPTPAYPNRVRHVWSQSQDQNARYWFPCLDYPHEKQTTSATIVVPAGMFALSNGALVERRDEGGKTIFRYEQRVPHSTYLVTLVAGPFVETAQSGAKVPVFYYVLPGREADGERAFAKTPAMIRVFEERIGVPYPYERYSQIAVGEFIFGGMENTAATTQTDRTLHDERAHLDFSSDPLVSHELAHQWFGDLLTCRDWSHAWLNEGFATYLEAVYREADLGRDEYLYDVFGALERYLQEDGGRYRRPVVYNKYRDPIELFDRHLYEKAGFVLHTLHNELGDARFWRAIAHYVEQHRGRNVETIDLIRAVEETTGRNMRGFFDQWIFRGGHPQVKYSAAYDGERRVLTLTVEQQQHIDDENPAYTFRVPVRVDGRAFSLDVEGAQQSFTVPAETPPELVIFDTEASVLADATFALGATFASAVLDSDADAVAKIRAMREAVKDGSQTSRDAIARLFSAGTFWGILAEAAHALGETRAPWAREILLQALSHEHPKMRRAAADAIGAFRDAGVAARLAESARSDPSYFVCAAALHSLGKTRDASAFAVLSGAIEESTWNGVVEGGAASGLGELGDPRAFAFLAAAASAGGDEGRRRAALHALVKHAGFVDSDRARVVDVIEQTLGDPMFMVARAAIRAAEDLGDRRLLPALDRLAQAAFDGRTRRDAVEAAMRIREAQSVPSQVTALRADLDALREEQRRLQEKIEALSRS